MGITEKDPAYARPALWGFFICIALAAVLLVVRFFIPLVIKARWDADRIALRTRAVQVIHDTFQKKTEQLAKIVEHASGDSIFVPGMHLDNESEALRAFQFLQSYRLTDDQTIDLIDSLGTNLAWNGPSIASLYKQVLHRHALEPFVYVTQNGLRLYLNVGKKLASDRFVLFVSEPLEVNSPISNRYVQKVSICEGLSQILKTQVTLKLPQTYTAREGEYSVPVVNLENKTIAEFFVREPTLESNI
jgi:hypothetical protein